MAAAIATFEQPGDAGPMRAGVAVSLRGVSKLFPGQLALNGVDLDLEAGKVRGLVGQNGSGKSTLIKVMAGFHQPEPGAQAWVDGEPFDLGSAAAAERAGMRFIHQDLGLVPTLDAVDNLALGHGYGSSGFVRMRAEADAARELLADFGFDFDVRLPVARLRPIERSGLAIVRALRVRDQSEALRVLVLDEPTESLGRQEVGRLFAAIRRATKRGAAILYVSHRLDEVLEIADDVTTLRDGGVVGTHPVAELDHDALIRLIIGRAPERLDASERPASDEVVLSTEHLGGETVRDASLQLCRGEILGVAGILGSGRDELPYLIGGARPVESGRMLLDGKPLGRLNPRAALAARIVFVAADRKSESSIPLLTVRENVTLPTLRPRGVLRWLGARAERRGMRDWLDRLDVRPPEPERTLATLSGGNQQKVVLARALRCEPRVLVVDEPVQGVDVGAKLAIHRLLRDAAERGLAIVIASSDPDDLANVCHRVVVMRDGCVAGELHGPSKTPDRIAEALLMPAQHTRQSEHS